MHETSARAGRLAGASTVAVATAVAVLLAVPGVTRAQSNSDRDRDMAIDATRREAVVAGAARELETGYFDPAVGRRMADAIRERARRGEYARLTSAVALADSLTTHLRLVSHDKHVGVDYSADVIPPPGAGETASPELIAARRRSAALHNHGLTRVERLDGNVGYLKVDGFYDPADGGETVAAAMAFVANTDALVIDLRDNHGGRPTMVALLATYLFAGDPVHLNDIWVREGNRTTQSYTLPYVPGRRYADKPVFVLTSAETISAGEEFANDLKVLKRATIVGETTAGGANPGGVARIDDHFGVFVPRGRAINPVTKGNWEGTGVTPDIAVPAARALVTAHRRALEQIRASSPDPMLARDVERALSALGETGRAAP